MSNQWDGKERRAHSELSERVERVEQSVCCLKTSMEEFHKEYGDILRETLEASRSRAKLKAAVAEKLVTGGIWAALAFLALAAWEWVKNHIGGSP
ncbi:MAG: hypothetical protein LC118_15690 [Dehalococcoidia bacterium]|nr:hypothetical protein [Dehalococcoidia bacterium]